MKENIKDILLIVGIIALLILGIAVAVLEDNHDEEVWNDGYCSECGCPWVYQDMYHKVHGQDIFIYTDIPVSVFPLILPDKEGHSIKVNKNYGLGIGQ